MKSSDIKGCTRLECIIRNNDMRQELGVQPITEITAWYKDRWRGRVMHTSACRQAICRNTKADDEL